MADQIRCCHNCVCRYGAGMRSKEFVRLNEEVPCQDNFLPILRHRQTCHETQMISIEALLTIEALPA